MVRKTGHIDIEIAPIDRILSLALGASLAFFPCSSFLLLIEPADFVLRVPFAGFIAFKLLLENRITTYQLEKRYQNKTGDCVWVLQSASLIRDLDGQPRHVIFQIQDITSRKDTEHLLHHAAFHDDLTGLPLVSVTVVTEPVLEHVARQDGRRGDRRAIAAIWEP